MQPIDTTLLIDPNLRARIVGRDACRWTIRGAIAAFLVAAPAMAAADDGPPIGVPSTEGGTERSSRGDAAPSPDPPRSPADPQSPAPAAPGTSPRADGADTEPVTEAIFAGVMVTALAQVAAGTAAVATFEFTVDCPLTLGASCERDVGVPEAVIPLAGPFVALGARDDLHPGLQAVLGISGALQVIGLATVIVGSTIQRPVVPKVGFSVGADGEGAFASVTLPL